MSNDILNLVSAKKIDSSAFHSKGLEMTQQTRASSFGRYRKQHFWRTPLVAPLLLTACVPGCPQKVEENPSSAGSDATEQTAAAWREWESEELPASFPRAHEFLVFLAPSGEQQAACSTAILLPESIHPVKNTSQKQKFNRRYGLTACSSAEQAVLFDGQWKAQWSQKIRLTPLQPRPVRATNTRSEAPCARWSLFSLEWPSAQEPTTPRQGLPLSFRPPAAEGDSLQAMRFASDSTADAPRLATRELLWDSPPPDPEAWGQPGRAHFFAVFKSQASASVWEAEDPGTPLFWSSAASRVLLGFAQGLSADLRSESSNRRGWSLVPSFGCTNAVLDGLYKKQQTTQKPPEPPVRG